MADLLGIEMRVNRLNGRNISMTATVDQNLSRALPQMLGDLGQQLARYQTVASAAAAITTPLLITKLAAMPGVLSAAAGTAGSLAAALAPGLAAGMGAVSAAAVTGGGALLGYGSALRQTWSYVGDFTQTMASQRSAVTSANKTLKDLPGILDSLPPGFVSAADKANAMAIAEQNAQYEAKRLATMFQIMTPRLVGLYKEVGEARLGMLRFGGSIMNSVAPALSELVASGRQFGSGFSAGANQMAASMTRTAVAAIKLGGSGQQLRSITTILNGMRAAGAPALSILTNALYLFLNVFQVAIPTGVRMVAMLAELVGAAQRWSASAAGQSQISAAWSRMVSVGRQLWTIARNVGSALWGVISALNASGVGQYLIAAAVRLSGEFQRLMAAGGQGRTAVTGFVRSLIPVLQAAGPLALDLVQGFFKLAGALLKVRMPGGGSAVVAVLNSMRSAVASLLPMLEHELKVILPLLPGLITQISEFAGIFLASTPELQLFIRGLTGVLGMFNALPDPLQMLIARVFAWGSAIGMLGGGAILGLIASMVRMRIIMSAISLATGRNVSTFAVLRNMLAPIGGLFTRLGGLLSSAGGWFVRIAGSVGGLAARLGPLALRLLPLLRVALVGLTGPVGIAVAVVSAAAFLIWKNWGWLVSQFQRLPGWIQTALMAVTFPIRMVGQLIRGIITGNWGPAIATARGMFNRLPGGAQQAVRIVGAALRLGGNVIRGIFTGNWAPAVASARQYWNLLPGGVRAAATTIGNVLRLAGGIIRGVFTGNWGPAIASARALWSRLPAGVRGPVALIGNILRTAGGIMRGIFTGNWGSAVAGARGLFNALPGRWQGAINRGVAVIRAVGGVLRAIFSGNWQGAINLALSIVGRLFPGIQSRVNRVRLLFNGMVAVVRQIFAGNFSGAMALALSIAGRLFPGVRARLSRIGGYVRAVIAAVRMAFSGNLSGAINLALMIFARLFPGVTQKLTRIAGWVSGWIGRIRGIFSGINLYQIGVNVIQGFLNGLNSMVNSVIAAARRIADSLPNWVKRRLGIASPSRVMRALGLNSGASYADAIASKVRAVKSAAQRLAVAARAGVAGDLPAPDLTQAPFSGGSLEHSYVVSGGVRQGRTLRVALGEELRAVRTTLEHEVSELREENRVAAWEAAQGVLQIAVGLQRSDLQKFLLSENLFDMVQEHQAHGGGRGG